MAISFWIPTLMLHASMYSWLEWVHAYLLSNCCVSLIETWYLFSVLSLILKCDTSLEMSVTMIALFRIQGMPPIRNFRHAFA